jgi:UDP-N-acetyl-2-amino-2-deoxyglucuronate dehydrogenase
MGKIKFAVVGCGHIGKRHAEMISRNQESELVALVDIKEASSLGLEIYQVPIFPSLDALLESNYIQEIDVINIATPNGFHADQAMQCLEAKKHVVIEKPMALNKQDAEKVFLKR